jgi:hypothetical protein
MEIVGKDIETKCIHDMSAGDCFQRGGSYFMVTDRFLIDSHNHKRQLCVNLITGHANFLNVWYCGVPVKAKVVIGEE